MAVQPRRALLVPLAPAAGAVLSLLILVLGLTLLDRDLPDAEPGVFSRPSAWIALVPLVALAYFAGLAVRRHRDGLRLLVSLAGGVAVAGAALLIAGLGEPRQSFPSDALWPGSDIGRAGLWFMILALGPIVAAWDINYRRTDPWYVLPVGLALGVWLIPLAAAISLLRDI